MANPYQDKQLSAPAVYVDGELIAVVPNRTTVRVPGDSKVRFMSAGGGSGHIVHGLNAESLVGHVKFEIANTAQNADRVKLWKQRQKDGEPSTVIVVNDTIQFPHTNMFMTKDTDLAFSADGNIPLEWEGEYAG